MSRYIDLLIKREKAKKRLYTDTLLPKIIEWHRERLDELNSDIAGVSKENAKKIKFRRAHQMHKMTIAYLQAGIKK